MHRTLARSIAAACVALAVVTAAWNAVDASVDPCRGRGTVLLVRADAHRLDVCVEGTSTIRHRVALGRRGVDKRREGDERTPLGTYAIGSPRRSSDFHRFIPVRYPTAAQRREGYTGSAIGVHGPARRSAWLGRATTWVDWTAGCIAVGSDESIDDVAARVRRRRITSIVIE